MWLALFITAEVTLIVWLAAIVLAVRDRVRGPVPLTELKAPPLAGKWAELSLPHKLLLVFLGVFALPVSALVLAILAIPFLAYNVAVQAFYWLRLKLFGVPIPVYTVPGTTESE